MVNSCRVPLPRARCNIIISTNFRYLLFANVRWNCSPPPPPVWNSANRKTDRGGGYDRTKRGFIYLSTLRPFKQRAKAARIQQCLPGNRIKIEISIIERTKSSARQKQSLDEFSSLTYSSTEAINPFKNAFISTWEEWKAFLTKRPRMAQFHIKPRCNWCIMLASGARTAGNHPLLQFVKREVWKKSCRQESHLAASFFVQFIARSS